MRWFDTDTNAGDARREQVLRIGVVVGLLGLFVGLGLSTIHRAGLGDKERTDFTVYHAAGQAVLDGTPLYEAKNVRGWYYMYLPIFAVLMVPLAVLPKVVAAGVFYLLSVAALLHLTATSARLATTGRTRAPPAFWVGVAALLLAGWPWMSGLTRGQASVMLSWLTVLSVAAFVRGGAAGRWGGAVALSLATLIRVFPGLLGLWLLLRGQWKSAIACAVAGLVLLMVVPSLVFGPRGNVALLGQWYATVAAPTGDAAAEDNERYGQMMNPRIRKNQSVQAVLVRWVAPREEPGEADPRETLARRIATGVNVVLMATTLGACVVAGRRRPGDTSVAVTQASAICLLMLFVPPVSWAHNYSLMILPLALAVARGRGDGPAARGYRLAVIAWAVGFAACFTKAGYGGGGFLIGALFVWGAITLDLLRTPAR